MSPRLLAPLLLPLAAAASAAPPTVLGRLGQATREVRLYAGPTTRARVLSTAKRFTYLIVRARPARQGWLRILMSNGVDGYAASSALAILPYEVTTKGMAGAAPRSAPSFAASGADLTSARVGMEVAGYSMRFQGIPYVWGGTDPNRGLDCSGFMLRIFENSGVKLPRTAAEQAKAGRAITRLEELRAGDRLYFWDKERNMIGHTGMYLGNGYFIHASRGKNKVATDPLSERWRRILVAVRR